MTTEVRFDVPTVDEETAPWWDAAREERLLVRRCDGCGRAFLYPRPFCPHCWSGDVRWEQASGDASLYTWSVVHQNALLPFRDRVPYVAAIVELAEGPRLSTVLDVPADAPLRIGMSLRVAYKHGDPVSLPCFVAARDVEC